MSANQQNSAEVMQVLKEFRLIFKSVKRHFQWVEKQTGISGAQLWAMAAVVEKPGIRVTELGQTMAIHQSTTSNLVERLVQADLQLRKPPMMQQLLAILLESQLPTTIMLRTLLQILERSAIMLMQFCTQVLHIQVLVLH